MADTVVYVVADGVTLHVADDRIFYAGDAVTADDFESVAEFKGLLAAGKIVTKEPGPPTPPPGPSGEWDGWSIDDALDESSPNPLKNSALTRIIQEIIAGGVEPISAEDIDALF